MQKSASEKIDRTSESLITRVAILSLATNIALVATKLSLSAITGSLALRADGIHSLIDVLSSVAVILGVNLSSRKSENFPYGLYKVENIASVVIAFLIFFSAYEIVMEALSAGGSSPSYSGWILIVVAAMIPIPYALSSYELRVGRENSSPSLIADGKEHRVDVLTASIVLFALLGQSLGIPLDSVAAIVVAVFIVRAGWGILRDSMRTILDASVDYATLDTMRSAILSDPTVVGIRNIAARNSGRYIFVEATVTMTQSDLRKAHQASERIQSKIYELVPNVERVMIHYEPEEKVHMRYVVPLQDLVGAIGLDFGRAPYFALIDFDVKEGRFEGEDIIPNQAREMERKRGINVAEMLLSHHPDVVFTKQSISGKAIEYAFKAAGVEVRGTSAQSLSQMIQQIETELRSRNASSDKD